MAKSFQRPKTEQELQEREAAGLWMAQALAKKIGGSNEKISLAVILRIHKVFQENATPEIAGRFRKKGEDIKKLTCMTPPPGVAVQEEMHTFWRDFDMQLSKVIPLPKGKVPKTVLEKRNDAVVKLAAWTQYQMARIHPFCEGNGRMARLMSNLILYRHKLLPTDIKYEGENKQVYLKALCEIDRNDDYRMLEQLIIKGIMASYEKLIVAKKGN